MGRAVLAVAAMLVLSACAGGRAGDADGPDAGAGVRPPLPDSGYATLRVGVATNYPPLAFAQDGKIRGIEPDFVRQLSEDTGIAATIVELPWEGLIDALRDERIDVIMSGMSMTRARSRLVAFVEPYMRVGQMCLIRADDIARLASPTVLFTRPWRVGFINGTTGELFAQKALPKATRIGFDTIEDGVAALHAKRIDYFIHDAPTIWRVTTDPVFRDDALLGLYQPLTEEYLAWAVRQDDEALLRFLDAVVQRWKDDGTLHRIIDRWIRVRLELRPPDSMTEGVTGDVP
jgi:ABC-type amino acid transport substrate-binding protein